MSNASHQKTSQQLTSEDLERMSSTELARLGTELDDVDVKFRKARWPANKTHAERRASRTVGFWLVLSIVGFLGYIVLMCVPGMWEFKMQGEPGYAWYNLYNVLLGVTASLGITSLGVAAVHYTKKFIPTEISVQTRHDGPSEEIDRKTTVALLDDAWQTSTLGRRKVLLGGAAGAAALFGLATVFSMSGIVKNPWKPRHHLDYQGDGTLWTTGWTQVKNPGEKLYLAKDLGTIAKRDADGHLTTEGLKRLVPLKADDMSPGSMQTVYPLRKKDLDSYEHQMHSIHGGRNSVMLIRLRAQDAVKAIPRKNQEDFNFGDYYAYSKICTHLACPTSLYEAQTNRILCPCHQSQFDALHYAKPVFGPAARALPQLPIAVDEDGYFYAKGDFIEAVGPAFWERDS